MLKPLILLDSSAAKPWSWFRFWLVLQKTETVRNRDETGVKPSETVSVVSVLA
jgi:hypothetical protein